MYTVPSSTTAIVLGLNLCNKSGSEINANVQVVSDTSDTETNVIDGAGADLILDIAGLASLLAGKVKGSQKRKGSKKKKSRTKFYNTNIPLIMLFVLFFIFLSINII